MMRVSNLVVVLCIVVNCASAPLAVSGVYNLIVGGLALTYVGGTSPITASTPSGATSQAWTAVFNPATGLATLQSVNALAFASISGDKFVLPSTTPFSWEVFTVNGQTLFCTADNFCISTAASGNSVGLAARGSGAPQSFDVPPITPPAVFYQIQNLGTNTIFGVGFVPSPAFVSPAPATDRSQIWGVTSVGTAQVSLMNLDSGGILSVGANGTIGGLDVRTFPWTVAFISGVGQVLLASGGFLTVSGGSLKIGSVLDSTTAWVFVPVNATAFLP